MNRLADVRHQPRPDADTSDGYHLRILATSDLHGAVLPYDYAADRGAGCFGLARTASLIAAARDTAPGACLLFDNGDFLQGTPLSELHATGLEGGPHPMIAAMNRLGYDAVGLGNHEFNFGITALRRALAAARFPVICANALTRQGAHVALDRTFLPPTQLIEREVADPAGKRRRLRIGVLALLPPQIATWDRFHLGHDIVARDMVETAAARVPMLRAQGADLVVLLAHTGIDTGPAQRGAENTALTLARLPGVDAIIAGHSHEVFPCEEAPVGAPVGAPGGASGADPAAGTFHGVPAVMPGFRGSHLGVIDLVLAHGANGWCVTGHRTQARPVNPGNGLPPAPADAAMVDAVRGAHDATLARLQAPLGRTARPIHTYLSRVRSDLAVRLVAEAQRQAVEDILAGGPFGGLPVLSAAAPYHTGGRAGPDAYTDIPPGPLTLRNTIDLQPFPNTLCAIRLTGAELRDWLERAVSCFCQIRPGLADQPLWDQRFPGHAADTIAGLSYRIDLTQPALYDDQGRRRPDAGPGRIRDLTHGGAPLDAQASFAVAMSNYRAFGGGPYPALPEDRIIHSSTTPVRDVLAGFIRSGGPDRLTPDPGWSFLPVPGATATIETGPGLRDHPQEMQAAGLADLGTTAKGFMRLRLALFTAACASAI